MHEIAQADVDAALAEFPGFLGRKIFEDASFGAYNLGMASLCFRLLDRLYEPHTRKLEGATETRRFFEGVVRVAGKAGLLGPLGEASQYVGKAHLFVALWKLDYDISPQVQREGASFNYFDVRMRKRPGAWPRMRRSRMSGHVDRPAQLVAYLSEGFDFTV
jgi:hypothetical protein